MGLCHDPMVMEGHGSERMVYGSRALVFVKGKPSGMRFETFSR